MFQKKTPTGTLTEKKLNYLNTQKRPQITLNSAVSIAIAELTNN